MFDKLSNHFKKTIYLTLIFLAVFFFLTTIFYSAYILYTDCKRKTLQISTQYARCLEIQLDSIAQPFALINNQSLSNALENNDSAYLSQTLKTLRMSHYSFSNVKIEKCEQPISKSEYENLTNTALTLKVPYNYSPGKYIIGNFRINLKMLKQVFEKNNNVFMKNAQLYLSLDGENFLHTNSTNGDALSYSKLTKKHDYFYTLTPIMNNQIYVAFLIPKSNIYKVIMLLILICIIILLSLTALSLFLARSYINHAITGLENLISNMDSYINEKGGEK